MHVAGLPTGHSLSYTDLAILSVYSVSQLSLCVVLVTLSSLSDPQHLPSAVSASSVPTSAIIVIFSNHL